MCEIIVFGCFSKFHIFFLDEDIYILQNILDIYCNHYLIK